jgi:hypothetical protein
MATSFGNGASVYASNPPDSMVKHSIAVARYAKRLLDRAPFPLNGPFFRRTGCWQAANTGRRSAGEKKVDNEAVRQ